VTVPDSAQHTNQWFTNMSFMKYNMFSFPKVVGTWTCANPDGATPSVVFTLDDSGRVNGKLGRHQATASAREKPPGKWTSTVGVSSDGERVLLVDFYHMAPAGSAMTDEITDFISCLMWSLYRADEIKKRNTEVTANG